MKRLQRILFTHFTSALTRDAFVMDAKRHVPTTLFWKVLFAEKLVVFAFALYCTVLSVLSKVNIQSYSVARVQCTSEDCTLDKSRYCTVSYLQSPFTQTRLVKMGKRIPEVGDVVQLHTLHIPRLGKKLITSRVGNFGAASAGMLTVYTLYTLVMSWRYRHDPCMQNTFFTR